MKKVAIVGFGFMGRTHYGSWKKIRGAKVVAICDSNLAQLTTKTKGNNTAADDTTEFPGVEIYDDFSRMLSECRCDIVDITLPTPLHPVMTIEALAAGKAVVCEKPMAVDAKTCDLMLKAAAKHHGKLMIAQCLRFQPWCHYIKELIDSGKYGKVTAADFQRVSMTPGWGGAGVRTWFLDESKSGGVALDLHIHDTDLVNWWFGRPKAVESRAHYFADGVMDHITTAYHFPDKVVTATGNWGAAKSFVFAATTRVVFERAVVEFNTRSGEFKLYTSDKVVTPKLPKEDGYYYELKAFLAWVEGKGPMPFDPAAARASVALVDAEKLSAKTGKAVKA